MSSQRRAELLLFLTTIVWGSTFVITKVVLQLSTPLYYTGIRFLLSTAILLVFFFRRMISIPRITFIRGSVLGILLFVGFTLQTFGLQYTTASKSAFFTGMLTVLTPIVHYTTQRFFKLSKKSIKIGNVLGVVCAAIGLYFLTSPSGAAFNVGDALSLGCALCFALYIVYLDTASDVPDKLQLTFVQFILVGFLAMICSPFLEVPSITFTTEFIIALLYLTIFATVITMWIQNRFQGDTTPTRAAVIFAMEPVIAGVFAYFVRGEQIGLLGLIGGGVIMVGLLLSELSDEIPFLRKEITEES